MQRILFVLDKLYDFFFFFFCKHFTCCDACFFDQCGDFRFMLTVKPTRWHSGISLFQVRFQAYIPARTSIEPFECMSGLFFCDRMTFSLIIPLFFPMLSRGGDVPAVFLTLSQALSVCVPESTCCSTLVLASRDHF